jgi:hypothetical protein
MKYILPIFVLIVYFESSLVGLSQGLHTTSNKALKIYKEGVSAYDYLDYYKAENDFKEALSIDKNFYEAYI